ncbi:MAG: helix-turn-helix transcriptional regulator [Flavobacteriales bacterium]|nr:helix-turn-helix transcriptional regulator [Flavobacteriales bacterium]
MCRKDGPTKNQVADLLDLDPKTVNAHMESVHRKWSVCNRVELLFEAMRRGMISCTCTAHRIGSGSTGNDPIA